MDEDEERRKRRREKNKVAAARCRNKKKERTDFLQRVSPGAETPAPSCTSLQMSQPFLSKTLPRLRPGIGASGDGELRAEGPNRGAPPGTAAADGDAEPPPAHLHREDGQCENAGERGQPSAGAAVLRRKIRSEGSRGRRPLNTKLEPPRQPFFSFVKLRKKKKTIQTNCNTFQNESTCSLS